LCCAGRRHRTRAQAHQQAAADHDDAAEENLERLGGSGVVVWRRLHRDVEAKQPL
jgi:hypothetical protein